MQYFKDKICQLVYYVKLTLRAKLNKNGMSTLKVQFFSQGKSNCCGVLFAYFGTGTFLVKKQQTVKKDRILILSISINDSEYILTNLYNANTEKKQIYPDVLCNLFELLEEFDTIPKKPS